MKTLFLFVLLFVFACGGDKKTGGGVVARVGKETLTKEELLKVDQYIKSHKFKSITYD